MISPSTSDPAVLLIGHGTRRAAGVAEFHALVARTGQDQMTFAKRDLPE